MLFLRWLPAQVRVQLTEDDHTDLWALAKKADCCASSLARQSADPLGVSAAMLKSEEVLSDAAEPSVSAVFRGNDNRGSRGGSSGHGPKAAAGVALKLLWT